MQAWGRGFGGSCLWGAPLAVLSCWDVEASEPTRPPAHSAYPLMHPPTPTQPPHPPRSATCLV